MFLGRSHSAQHGAPIAVIGAGTGLGPVAESAVERGGLGEELEIERCHLTWECSAFSSTRFNVPIDRYSLPKTMGWPVGANVAEDNAVVHHLSFVRERVLDRRYRSH